MTNIYAEEATSDCVICKIVTERIPSWIVYDNTEVICYLPKDLAAYGHTVVAPKEHHTNLYDTPEALLNAVISTAKRLAAHYNSRIGSSGVNILHASGISAQQSVPHLHFHLIPRFEGDGLDAWPPFPIVECNKDELLEKLRLE